jgi:predicted MFS family arabinose efflux permease
VLASGAVVGGLACVALFSVRDAPPGHAFWSRVPEGPAEMLGGLRDVLSTSAIWHVLALQFIGYSVVTTVRGLWAGPYLHDVYGLEGAALGNALLVITLAIIAGALAYGPLDRWFKTRKWVALPGCAVTMVSLGFLASVPGLPLASLLVVLGVFGFAGAFYVLTMPHAKGLFADRLAGRAMTSISLAAFAGVAVMQPLTGFVLDAFAGDTVPPPESAYRGMFAFLTVMLVVALLIYSRSRDVKPGAPQPRP